MSCAIFLPTSSLSHSSSNYSISIPKNAIFQHVKCIPQLVFSQWSGLKHMGISISQYSVKIERKGKYKGKGVYASLFGVGAPEALVIGVVALLVFGPKGLAEIARNLGKTLREFQPTIRELQEVSRDFKSTLEREIGLDDLPPKSSASNTIKPPMAENEPQDSGTGIEPDGIPSEIKEESNETNVKMTQVQLLGVLAQLKKEQQEEEKEKVESQAEAESQNDSQVLDTPEEVSSVPTPTQNVESDTLQEAAFAVYPGLAPQKPESET